MKLTNEELNIIEKHRAEVQLKERRNFVNLEILRITALFLAWNESEGMALTPSVFIDDFGAEDVIHHSLIENIGTICKAVREVMEAAENYSKIIGD